MGNMLLSAICSISNIPSFETWFSLIQTENHYNSLMPGIAGSDCCNGFRFRWSL